MKALHTPFESQAQDQEDPAQNALKTPASSRRRYLLLGAASSFFLSARGLLLPFTQAEDAEAENHPVGGLQGRKDQRRNKRRHKFDQRRNQRDRGKGQGKRRSRQKSRGSKGFNGIEFHLEIEGYRQVKVDLYATRPEFSWGLVKSQRLGPAEKATFGGTLDPCAVWIDGRFWVEAVNPTLDTPKLKVGYGGSVGSDGWRNGRILFDGPTREGDSFQPSIIDGYNIQVTRLTDNPNKVFKVFFEAPPL